MAKVPGCSAESVAQQVGALEVMERDALLALWSATSGGEPPARLSQPLLRRMLAFDLQVQQHGGLPLAVTKKLESLAVAGARGQEKAAAPKLKSGGRLLREWNGITHVVDVVEGGFLWRGKRHRSLSAIARAITGAHWSGPRFFGLQEGAGGARAAGTKHSKDRNNRKADILPRTVGDAPAKAAATPSRRRSA